MKTKLQNICDTVKDDLHWMIDSAIVFGDDRVTYEKEFGNGIVGVEYYPVRLRNGMVIMIKDVYVLHDRGTGRSPMLVDALKKALPEWEEVEREIEDETN